MRQFSLAPAPSAATPAAAEASPFSYETFGAVTMISKMYGSVDKLPDYFGPEATTKTRLDKVRTADEAKYRNAYERLHLEYEDWKRAQVTA